MACMGGRQRGCEPGREEEPRIPQTAQVRHSYDASGGHEKGELLWPGSRGELCG